MVVYNQGMIITIIAGGSGTRLWPLSQSNHPKHLLKLIGERSLLQNTFDRASEIAESVYIITESSHSDEVKAQLPELPEDHVIIEPGRRGTAYCIALALATIKKAHGAEVPVVFIHADSHINDNTSFGNTLKIAAKNSVERGEITLIGIRPSYPATGFGYIEVGDKLSEENGIEVHKVVRFKEKPELKVAKQFVESGSYIWNMGLFAGSTAVFQKAMYKYAPEFEQRFKLLESVIDDASKLNETYLSFPSIAIEYELLEKAKNLDVVAGTFEWADIGSFFDLHKILKDENSNTLKGDVELIDSEDVMVHGSDKPVVVIGLSGVVVVDSPNGLLVCAKEKSQLVGEAAKRIQARNPKN